jgi:ribosomal protein S17
MKIDSNHHEIQFMNREEVAVAVEAADRNQITMLALVLMRDKMHKNVVVNRHRHRLRLLIQTETRKQISIYREAHKLVLIVVVQMCENMNITNNGTHRQ